MNDETALLVRLRRAELESLAPEQLCLRCLDAVIPAVRGKPLTARLQAYEALAPGPRAILGIWILYHYGRNGWGELLHSLQHLWPHSGFWAELRAAGRHFGLDQVVDVIDQVERALIQPEGEPADALARLDSDLARVRPTAIREVARLVRARPADYLEITG